jgi:hypothetical protein
MPNPEIKVVRSIGWDTASWQLELPHIQRAALTAQRGIDFLGITYEAPKFGRIRRSSSEKILQFAGLAYNANNFSLHMSRYGKEMRNQRVASLSSAAVHEVIHCARMEEYPISSAAERAATEGLAYFGENLFVNKFFSAQLEGYHFYKYPEEDREIDKKIRSQVDDPNITVDDRLQWFEKLSSMGIPEGALYGVQRVQRQLDSGYTIADLIRQPSRDVLGL